MTTHCATCGSTILTGAGCPVHGNGEAPDALDFAHARIDALSAQLDAARWHLAQTLPDNWNEHEDTRAAVAFLGGSVQLARLRARRSP